MRAGTDALEIERPMESLVAVELRWRLGVQHFDSDGIQIAYEVVGDGPPILLVHGFAASYERNWQRTGWVDTLLARGRRVIGIDCRGHGASTRPIGLQHYSDGKMQGDLLNLLDHLRIERADLFGYSMGAWMLLPLLSAETDRFQSAILGGAGAPLPETRSLHEVIVAVFEGIEPPATASPLESAVARGFRAFAEANGNDMVALSCVLRSGVLRGDALGEFKKCPIPVLVTAGDRDGIAGDPGALSAAIPGSQLIEVAGGDHLSTLNSEIFRDGILAFLEEHGLS